jgi:hypothetical protein
MATGTITMNFGTSASRKATSYVDVTGLSGLTSASYIEPFPMAEATADHTADVVRVDKVDYICQFLDATSFRIYGTCARGHTYGDRTVRWATA